MKAWLKTHTWHITITVLAVVILVVGLKKWGPSWETTKSSEDKTTAQPTVTAVDFFGTAPTGTTVRVDFGDTNVELVKTANGGAKGVVQGRLPVIWEKGPYNGTISPTFQLGKIVGLHTSATTNSPPEGLLIPEEYRLQYRWHQVQADEKRLLGVHEGVYDTQPGQVWVIEPTFEFSGPKLEDSVKKKGK